MGFRMLRKMKREKINIFVYYRFMAVKILFER